MILDQRSDVEQFFLEALEQIKDEAEEAKRLTNLKDMYKQVTDCWKENPADLTEKEATEHAG